MPALKNYFIRITALALLLAPVAAALNYFSPFFSSFAAFTWIALVFFYAVTLLSGYLGIRSLTKTAYGFVAGVNGMVMLKLFLSIAFLIGYLVLAKPDGPRFAVSFFVLYATFTAFEIRELILIQKLQEKKKNGQP